MSTNIKLPVDVVARIESGKMLREILDKETLIFYLRKIERQDGLWIRTYNVHVRDLNVSELVGHVVDGFLSDAVKNPEHAFVTVEVSKSDRGALLVTPTPIELIMEAVDTMLDMTEGKHIDYMVIK